MYFDVAMFGAVFHATSLVFEPYRFDPSRIYQSPFSSLTKWAVPRGIWRANAAGPIDGV